MKAVFGFLSIFMIITFSSEIPPKEATEYKLIIFEGSDWCRNCRRLEKEVLSQEAFIRFLDKNLIEVEKIDFPQRQKLAKEVSAYNTTIAEKYSFEGIFPTIVLEHLGSTSFYKWTEYLNQPVDKIIEQLENKLESLR